MTKLFKKKFGSTWSQNYSYYKTQGHGSGYFGRKVLGSEIYQNSSGETNKFSRNKTREVGGGYKFEHKSSSRYGMEGGSKFGTMTTNHTMNTSHTYSNHQSGFGSRNGSRIETSNIGRGYSSNFGGGYSSNIGGSTITTHGTFKPGYNSHHQKLTAEVNHQKVDLSHHSNQLNTEIKIAGRRKRRYSRDKLKGMRESIRQRTEHAQEMINIHHISMEEIKSRYGKDIADLTKIRKNRTPQVYKETVENYRTIKTVIDLQ